MERDNIVDFYAKNLPKSTDYIRMVYTRNHIKCWDKYGNVCFEYPKKKNIDFLVLFSKVKAEARRYVERFPYDENEIKVDYRDYIFFDEDKIKGVECNKYGVEIDINAAYWNVARQMFLSDDTYLLGLKKKGVRLHALGALAAKKTEEVWERGVLISRVETYPDTQPIFFDIAKRVSGVVKMCHMAANKVFGYYVDCVFLSEDDKFDKQIVYELLHASGLTGKEIKCGYALFMTEKYVNLRVDDGKNAKHYIFLRSKNGRKNDRNLVGS